MERDADGRQAPEFLALQGLMDERNRARRNLLESTSLQRLMERRDSQMQVQAMHGI